MSSAFSLNTYYLIDLSIFYFRIVCAVFNPITKPIVANKGKTTIKDKPNAAPIVVTAAASSPNIPPTNDP
jgi:hypothetical protein